MDRRGGKISLKGVYYERLPSGTVRWVYRDKRGKKQLKGIFGEPPLAITPAVMDAYNAAREALGGKELRGSATLGWLIEKYLREKHFASKLTLADQRSVLGRIQTSHGHRPFATMKTKHVEALRDEVGGHPGNKRVKYLKQMFGWATKQGIAKTNPTIEAEKIKIASEGYTAWTREDVLAFEERHPVGTKARLAFALFLYTGQRVSDVAQWGPLNLRAGRLVYVQHKGRTQQIKRRSIPVTPPLQAILDASPLGTTMWLETDYGKPFSIKGLGNKMRQWCDEADLKELSAHGIRKATGNLAAERGCSAHQIMQILGVTLAIAESYTRAADEIRLADAGFARTFGDES